MCEYACEENNRGLKVSVAKIYVVSAYAIRVERRIANKQLLLHTTSYKLWHTNTIKNLIETQHHFILFCLQSSKKY